MFLNLKKNQSKNNCFLGVVYLLIFISTLFIDDRVSQKKALIT